MTRRLASLGLRVALVVSAAVLLAFAPVAAPAARTSASEGAAMALATAAVSFGILARRLRPPPLRRPGVARAVALAVPAVATAAAVEEILWRYGALGALRTELGVGLAVLVSTVGFAAAHGPFGLRAVRASLLTGSAFAATYLATGRLAAAILAHVVYNLLVVAAAAARLDEHAAAAPS